tara:strand:+ start:473 stop:1078 length:606 start_codon:yes stop_codon:yes gene_type:complete
MAELRKFESITGKISEIFPTHIYTGEISQETHDATLARLADVEWERVPLTNKSHGMNVSKKLNKPSFGADVISEFELDELHEELGHHIRALCDGMGVGMDISGRSSWITQYHKGDYAVQHHHGTSAISMAYYLSSNGMDGDFYFCDHSPARFVPFTADMGNLLSIPPKERKLILFPGWMEHGVNQNETDHVRRCLSANFYR